VLQAEAGLKWELEKTTLDLREKRLAVFEDAQVRSLSVELGETRYFLKKEGVLWKLVAPLADRADETTVGRLLGAVRQLRALRFVTDLANPLEDERYGLAQPALQAIVTLHDGTRHTLVIGRAEIDGAPRSFARRKEGTSIAEVPADALLRELDVSSFALRDKRVLGFERDRVEKIRIALADGQTLELDRVRSGADAGIEDDWKFAGPQPGPARKWKVGSLLWALASMKASAFADEAPADLAPFGLARPERTVTLLGEGGAQLGVLFIGKTEGARTFVRTSFDRKVFEVDEASLREVPAARADLEEKAEPGPGPAE
jgi:hypothetical protein